MHASHTSTPRAANHGFFSSASSNHGSEATSTSDTTQMTTSACPTTSSASMAPVTALPPIPRCNSFVTATSSSNGGGGTSANGGEYTGCRRCCPSVELESYASGGGESSLSTPSSSATRAGLYSVPSQHFTRHHTASSSTTTPTHHHTHSHRVHPATIPANTSSFTISASSSSNQLNSSVNSNSAGGSNIFQNVIYIVDLQTTFTMLPIDLGTMVESPPPRPPTLTFGPARSASLELGSVPLLAASPTKTGSSANLSNPPPSHRHNSHPTNDDEDDYDSIDDVMNNWMVSLELRAPATGARAVTSKLPLQWAASWTSGFARWSQGWTITLGEGIDPEDAMHVAVKLHSVGPILGSASGAPFLDKVLDEVVLRIEDMPVGGNFARCRMEFAFGYITAILKVCPRRGFSKFSLPTSGWASPLTVAAAAASAVASSTAGSSSSSSSSSSCPNSGDPPPNPTQPPCAKKPKTRRRSLLAWLTGCYGAPNE